MLEILYESDRLIAVNKPAGLVTIPERQPGPTLVDQVRGMAGGTIYVVHRLDREVSGVVLFARDDSTHRYLNTLFERRHVVKQYRAIVLGNVNPKEGTIDAPIREFGSGRMGVDPLKGKASTTGYQVIHTTEDFSELNVFPMTGRRHQIRVHLYHLGHPIAGDEKYGDRTIQSRFQRLYLHACRLEINTPFEKNLVIEAPVPESFRLPPA